MIDAAIESDNLQNLTFFACYTIQDFFKMKKSCFCKFDTQIIRHLVQPLNVNYEMLKQAVLPLVFFFFKFLFFWLHSRCWKWEGMALKSQINHTGWMTVVAPIDRPKSVRNCYAMEHFCSVFVLLYLCIVCRLGEFATRVHQIASLFSLDNMAMPDH